MRSRVETLETGYAQINGARLYYQVAGTGHPLVLIHGGLVDHRLWDEQFLVLAQQYRVIRYDLRGYGLSSPTSDAHEHCDDLQSLLNQLDVSQAHFVGLSLGGAVALDFALAWPRMVSTLVLAGSGLPGSQVNLDSEIEQKFQELQRAFQNGDSPRGIELFLEIWMVGARRQINQVDQQTRTRITEMVQFAVRRSKTMQSIKWREPQIAERLAEIRVPTLIAVGEFDQQWMFDNAAILCKSIRRSRQVIIPGGAHHFVMENPVEFNRSVLDFLAQVSRSSE